MVIDRFEDPAGEAGGSRGSEQLLKLYCTIVVDRDSQKPIVVGKGGAMIKRIGTAAREDLERFFRTRVYLDLQVRVKTEWREDDRLLEQLGLGPK